MRRALLGLALAIVAAVLAACDAADPADGARPPPDDVDAEEGQAVDPGEIGPDPELFGLRFEGLWRFEQATEVALVLDADAPLADLVDELGAHDGVAAVTELGAGAVQERGALDALLAPDEPVPSVLLVTAIDHGTALSLGALRSRGEVRLALVPTCDALAGTARLHGPGRAQALLDAAGCRQFVVVAADPDADTPWVAAAGADADTVCIAAAFQDGPSATSSSACSRRPEDPGLPVASLSGGFVVGFAPPGTATVALEAGDQTAAVQPATVAGGAALAYAAYLPAADRGEALVVGTRDIADITWRFLDAHGTVIDQG